MQQKKTDRKLIALILVNLAIAILIFIFSAQPAAVSAPLSGSFTYNIIKPVLSMAGMTEKEITKVAFNIHGLIRKLAHFGIYMTFGITLKLMYLRIKAKHPQLITLATGLAYAFSDEIHQLFVPGRSGELRDVLIDFSGVCTGTFILFIIFKFIQKIRRK